MNCKSFFVAMFRHINRGVNLILQLPFIGHLIIGLCIRLLLIIYGCYHDSISHVKYTDVDYRVFTDAARHVMKGESPYERHTYRYSPIIAWLLLPNIFLHESFGKVLFSVCDIMMSMCIRSIVRRQLRGKVTADRVAKYCSLFWLYNPISIGISTRGNADSVSCLFILLSLYFLQADNSPLKGNTQYFLSGIFLGVSIHLRLYPIVFCFPMYLSLADYKINRYTPLKTGLLSIVIPNRKQIMLAATTIIYIVTCTYGMYLIYGYKFIFETYIYHLFRKDTRHNFSLFFYYSYLRMGESSFDFTAYTTKVFVAIILIFLSLAFGSNPLTLPFALFCQAAILVIYNSVVTSQYFVWYLSLLPLIVHDIRASAKEGALFTIMWTFSQLTWLFYAYLLEFLNQEVFIVVWVAGVFFFFSTIVVLHQLIALYTPGHGFGIAHVNVAEKDE